MTARVRPVGTFDLEVVAQLHAASFEEVWGIKAIGEILAMPGAFGLMAAAEAEGDGCEPAAFLLARIVAEDCEILSVGVAPAHRRRGFARLLLSQATEFAAASGARRMFLEVAEDNWSARGLYASLGFAPVGRRRDYYRRTSGHAAALTMRRLLPAG